jgi:hypothetical protein
MSEAPGPLEAELAALRPHEVSPGLRRRIAERLADAPRPKRRRLWRIAFAACLAAACLAAVLLWWGGRRSVEPEPRLVQPKPPPPVAIDESEPTLRAYQRALARSAEDLDALLTQHGLSPEAHTDLVPTGAFPHSDAALHDLLGED